MSGTVFERLRATATLAGDALARWRASTLFVFGCGNLGTRFAREAVRSGARVVLCDPDRGEPSNLAVQDGVRVGRPKALALARECNRIASRAARAAPAAGSALGEPRARALVADLRHVGLRTLLEADLFVDTTDDPACAPYLAEVSNGLVTPLLRIAIDGSGAHELGRALVSHGGAGHACALCSWSAEDLLLPGRAMPCPGRDAGRDTGRDPGAGLPDRPPTLAGGAIGMAVAGLGLLQAQRVLGGNAAELALDREVRLDLSAFALVPVELPRSADCLGGHEPWSWIDVPTPAAETTVAALFEHAGAALDVPPGDVLLEPFGHVLRVGASCDCGRTSSAVGTRFAPPRPCPCGRPTEWHAALHLQHVDAATARELALLDRSALELGLPDDGALFVARCAGRTPRRLLLATSRNPIRHLSHLATSCTTPTPLPTPTGPHDGTPASA